MHVIPFNLVIFAEKSSQKLMIAVYQPVKMYPEYPCVLTSVPRDYRKIGNGLVFEKNWPYTRFINFHLLKVPSFKKVVKLAKNSPLLVF